MTAESADLPALSDSPLAFLHAVAQAAPSKQYLQLLSEDIVSVLECSPDLSGLYLYAVAHHIPSENLATSNTVMATTADIAGATVDSSQYAPKLIKVSIECEAC